MKYKVGDHFMHQCPCGCEYVYLKIEETIPGADCPYYVARFGAERDFIAGYAYRNNTYLDEGRLLGRLEQLILLRTISDDDEI